MSGPRGTAPPMVDSLHEIAVALCRADAAECVRGRLGPLADADFTRRLIVLLRRHGVMGLAAATLTSRPLATALPEEVRVELQAIVSRLRRRAALWILERDRILSILQQAGITPVMLKGGGLSTTLYAEPLQREFGDLDLLVPEDQFDRTVARLLDSGYENPWNALQLEGYRRHHFHLRLTHPGGFIVEVHFRLSARDAPFRLDAGEFLAQSVMHDTAREAVLRLPRPEHQLLHMVAQNATDAFNQLVRLVDIDRLVRAHPQLQWDVVERAARHGGLKSAVAMSLHLTRTLLAAPIPESILRRFDPGRVTRFHLVILRPVPWLLREHFARRPAAARLLTVWIIPHHGDRWRFLARRDPIEWIWSGREQLAEHDQSRWGGLISLAKLLLYQVGVYLSGAAAVVTPRGRAELRYRS